MNRTRSHPMPARSARSAPPGPSLQPSAHPVDPELECAVELRPRIDRRRVSPSPAIDALREKRVRLRVPDLTLDRRGLDELAQLGPKVSVTVWFGLARGRQHVEYGIRGACLGDGQAQP